MNTYILFHDFFCTVAIIDASNPEQAWGILQGKVPEMNGHLDDYDIQVIDATENYYERENDLIRYLDRDRILNLKKEYT